MSDQISHPARRRLTSEDWLEAGLKALSNHGHSTLKAETLARQLNTTKGSFYWHFKDVPDFQAQILSSWMQRAERETDKVLANERNTAGLLRHLCQHITRCQDGPDLKEAALRAWGLHSKEVRTVVVRLDDMRLDHLQSLLAETGISNPEMARILNAAAIGMATQSAQDTEENENMIGSLVDLVLALR